MAALAVVEGLDVLEHGGLKLEPARPAAAVDELFLERGEERLGDGVVVGVSVVLGALVGRTSTETRTTTGLVSGLRFGSLGLIIIGTQLDGNPDDLGPAIVFSLVDLILVLFLSVELGRHAEPARAAEPEPRSDPITAAAGTR